MTPLAIKNVALVGLSGVLTAIISALGGWDMAIQALFAVMVIDIITGLLVALVWKKSGKTATGAVESKAMLKGLCRKFVMILIVFIANLIDSSMGLNGILRTGSILFFTGNEGLSIVENVGIMGVPLPKFLKEAFEQLRNKGDDTEVK
jgi:toxin secretion/phage lysis holin